MSFEKSHRIDGKWNVWKRTQFNNGWIIIRVFKTEQEADTYINRRNEK